MLKLFYSNRYESLVEALLNDLATDTPGPWGNLPVIAPSAALRRRLEFDIARRFGICANIAFDYLAQWLWTQIGHVLEVPECSPYAIDPLAWRIFRWLSADHAQLWRGTRAASYLADADDTMRYELARRIAAVFDQYLTYRPEWLAAWSGGQSIFAPPADLASPAARGEPNRPAADATQRDDERWQAALWRALSAELSAERRTAAQQAAGITEIDTVDASPPIHRFLELAPHLDPDTVKRANWPASVAVFALPTMPPLSIALLRELSRWIEVRLYLFNPCREYWYDIVDEARIRHLMLAGTHDYQEVGNPLLAEWGRQTQAQLHMLSELTDGAVACEASHYVSAAPSSWLAAVQNAILNLAPLPIPPDTADAPDPSSGIEIHVCHSLSRQLEVIHDRLLALFNADPTLEPGDVMVALPDLAAAAPLIDAVFGTAGLSGAPCHIPYQITGLPPSRVNPLARMLLELLALNEQGESGMASGELIEWLRIEAVAARYGLDTAALDTLHEWLIAAGARRGIAPAPSTDISPCGTSCQRHTLADALTRLFLGYAMPDHAEPVGDWLPIAGSGSATGLGSTQAQWLGQLARFVENVETFREAILAPRDATSWRLLLDDALACFFEHDSAFADSLAALRDALNTLFETLSATAPEMPVSASVMRIALRTALDDPARGGVPGGGVTFCPLTSLRGLPYRVVCLAGLDNSALPGAATADEFDLIAPLRRPGDRQRRDEARNLFLDLLLAARDHLLITYCGRSIRDNAPLPPSTLIDELLDYLALARAGVNASPDARRAAHASFVTEHPLQPFSRDYLTGRDPSHTMSGGPLYTYRSDRAEIASALASANQTAAPLFFSGPLPSTRESAGAALDFNALVQFFRHPGRALLRNRLGITLPNARPVRLDNEPFEVDYAARDAFVARLLPALLETPDIYDSFSTAVDEQARLARAQRIAQASPELPGGALGAIWQANELSALTAFAARVRTALNSAAPPLPFALPIEPAWPVQLLANELVTVTDLHTTVLTGALSGLTSRGLVLYRYAPVTPRDYLAAWLAHLVLASIAPPGIPLRTRWFASDSSFALDPVCAPQQRLAEGVALYQAGCQWPLRLFPKTSWFEVLKGPAKSREQWHGSPQRAGESSDAYWQIALRGVADPLAEPFAALARAVFEPLLAHRVTADMIDKTDG